MRSRRVAVVVVAAVAAALAAADARAEPARPAIVWRPIPFGAKRRGQTAVYAARHYGIRSWRLRPRLIVEHYSESSTFSSVYWTFASDRPDPDAHDLPGACTHFVVDRDGAIYQLVPLDTICRHVSGLNYLAIGIENVGWSDRQVLDDRRQLAASLRLTLWLMGRYRISLANVIGHNENLVNPFYRDRVRAWHCMTHADWRRADMEVYRRLLARLADRYAVPLGPPAPPPRLHCR